MSPVDPLDPIRRIWVGGAGSATGLGLIRCIRDAWGASATILAADTNPPELVPAAHFADEFITVAPADDPVFAKTLGGALAEHEIDTYVPLIDTEIVLAADAAQSGALGDVVVVAPLAASARLCLDKLATAKRLAEAAVPTPATTGLADATLAGDGLILKQRSGWGSVGVRTIETSEQLEHARRELSDAAWIAQRRCRGPEITIDGLRSNDPPLFRAVCRERLEVKAGVCTKAVVFEDSELGALAEAAAAALELTGPFTVQAMQDPGGGWAVTDVNPRVGGGTRMSALAGVDVGAAGLAIRWGIDPAPLISPLPGRRTVIRYLDELVGAADDQ